MWILPKQLHTSHFVPDTAALISDLAEQSQVCAQSLFLRSKPSLARTWLLKWKRDSWTQHLYGRILKPSHGQSFVTAWTSCLEVIPANPFQQQANDLDETTLDTSGLGLQMELELCVPESASSRTSRDTSASDSERSSANWKALVTRLRGEYSLRVKSAHHTRENESSSWPTVRASDCHNSPTSEQSGERYAQLRSVVSWPTATSRDWKGAYSKESHQKKNRMSLLPDMVAHWPTPTVQEAGKIGNQANHGQLALSNHPAIRGEVSRDKYEKGKHGQAVPVSPSTDGSRLESWGTPAANDANKTPHCEVNSKQAGLARSVGLELQKQWGTPRCSMAQDKQEDSGKHRLGEQIQHRTTGKLNPRWVETLMGLPVGWTMPSCASPLTIAPTNSDYSETESCQPQPSEHSELF